MQNDIAGTQDIQDLTSNIKSMIDTQNFPEPHKAFVLKCVKDILYDRLAKEQFSSHKISQYTSKTEERQNNRVREKEGFGPKL